MAEELGEETDVVHRPLGVCNTHVPIQEVDGSEAARVVVAVLGTRHGVQFQVHAQTVLARPLDREEDVIPRLIGEEGFARPGLDGPVRYGETDPIEASACDLGEILLGLCIHAMVRMDGEMRNVAETLGGTHNERLVVFLDLVNPTTLACVVQHRNAQTPFIDGLARRKRRGGRHILVLLEKGGYDERFEDEPTTKVHTPDLVRGVIPRLGERLGERLRPCAVIERILWIVDPWIKVEEVRKL